MAHTIRIWTTPTCPYCKMTKEFLTKQGYEYTDYDVTANKEALEEMKKISSGLSVPVIVIDDNEPIIGFEKEKIEKLLQE